MGKVFPVGTSAKETVVVFDDMPFTCGECKKEFCFTSKEQSRWLTKRMWEHGSPKIETCPPCNEKIDHARAKEFEQYLKEKKAALNKRRQRRERWKRNRVNRIAVSVVCDRCKTEVSSSFRVIAEVRLPEGWENFPSTNQRKGELCCTDCVVVRRRER